MLRALRAQQAGCLCRRAFATIPHSRADDIASRVAAGVVQGDRFMLSKAMTFAESTRDDHRRIGADILDQALRDRTRGLAKARSAGQQVKETLRVGISGPPGVGKSTFIEALGVALIRDHGLRVAVIAIDPTSHKSSGAILGDKTRMTDLSMMAEAFVRPCAAGFKHLGGLSLHSDELVLLCEAAGYDVVLIETVGVGQSETLVTEVADMCVLLLPPAGGDELQGIKRGIVETADLIVVNKADGDLLMAAKRARSEYRAALHVMHSTHAVAADQDGHVGRRVGKHAETREWEPRVTLVSATTGLGIDTVCGLLFEYLQVQVERGQLHARRSGQRGAWMWRKAEADLVSLLGAAPAVASRAGLGPSPRAGRMRAQNRQGELAEALGRSEISSRAAARELVRSFVASVQSS